MITSPASSPWLVAPTSSAGIVRRARMAVRIIAAAALAILVSLFIAGIFPTLLGYRPFIVLSESPVMLFLLACPGLLLALDALVLARLERFNGQRGAGARESAVRYVGSDAAELVLRGRAALAEDGPGIAGYLFDRAIAADPFYEEAWLLKAACQDSQADRLTCLEAGLALNPTSATLKEALG